jgi:hypothetical protein
MLYESVDNSLETLRSQWQGLRDTLAGFAGTLPVDSVREQIRAPADLDQPLTGGLAKNCQDLIALVVAEQAGVRTWTPMSLLVSHFNTFFRLQDSQREIIQNKFSGLFPLALPDTGAVKGILDLCNRIGEFIEGVIESVEEAVSEEANRVNVGRLRGAVEDIASYPLLTSELRAAPFPSSGGYDGGGALSLRRQVDGAVREVLGRLPRTSDPRSFVAALKQSFEIIEVEGHTDFRWTPRTYAGQTELGGGVTGAQASLYTRAQVALDRSLPLLDGLYPLLPDADPELTDASRAIVRTELTAVVGELSMEGGPRFARVDGLFDSLLRGATIENGSTIPDGHLGYLQAKFGLEKDLINTLDEESNFSNFTVFQDYIFSIEDSWKRFKSLFEEKDLGTNLVQLSRALSVTGESVGEVRAAMDSVFIGVAERQVARFPDGAGHTILVDDLLSWVVTFASEEAPALVQQGGKRGIAAIVPTAQQLANLIRRFVEAIPSDPLLPDGLRHPRVLHPLQELRTYLEQVHDLAANVGLG